MRYLREHDIGVLEVNQPHAHTRRRRGKSDPIDAEMAARLALAGKATTIPKQTDGIERLLACCGQRSALPGPGHVRALLDAGEPFAWVNASRGML